MITLYYRPTCPYSMKVMEVARELGVPLDLRDVNKEANRDALVAKGGKRQVPFMVDEANGTALYDSMDIVDYLHSRYA